MMHYTTEFGNKMFGGLENIIWINIDVLTLRCDLDLECNNPFFHTTHQLMIQYYQTTFDCKWTSSLEDIVEIVIL